MMKLTAVLLLVALFAVASAQYGMGGYGYGYPGRYGYGMGGYGRPFGYGGYGKQIRFEKA